MSVTPKRNLPPQSEVWGRSVDQRLDTIQAQSSRQNQDIGNTLTGVNASLVRLSEQVGEIRTITETLVEQQATLQAQQEQLQTQQQTLTQTVNELQTAVNAMVIPRSGGGEQRGFDITGTPTPVVTLNIATPEGYSRALILAVSTVTGCNSTAVQGFLYATLNANGRSFGGTYNAGLPNSWTQTTTHGATVLSDLSPGQNISVVTDAYTASPPQTWVNTGNRVKASVQILFLR